MGKITKRVIGGTLISFFVLVILIISTFFILNFLKFSPLTDFISKQVSQSLDRKVTVNAISFGYSFAEGLSLKVEGLNIQNPENIQNSKNFLTIKKSQIDLSLGKLIIGNINVNQVLIDNLTLNLIENNESKNNWTFGQKEHHDAVETKKEITEVKNKQIKKTQEKLGQLFNFSWLDQVPNISIKNSIISYQSPKENYTFTIIDQVLFAQKHSLFDKKISGTLKFQNITLMTDGSIQGNKKNPDQLNFDFSISDQYKNKINFFGGVNYDKNHLLVSHITSTGDLINLKPWQAIFLVYGEQIRNLKSLNWNSKFLINENQSLNLEAHLNTIYTDDSYQSIIKIASKNNQNLLPLTFSFSAQDKDNNLNANVNGKMDNPSDDKKWFSAKIISSFKNPSQIYPSQGLMYFRNLKLNASVEGNAKTFAVTQGHFETLFKDKPFDISFNYKLENHHDRYPMVFDISSKFNNQPVLELKGQGVWPINQPNWLNAQLRLNLANLSDWLNSFKITTPGYKIQALSSDINLNGEKSNVLDAEIKNTKVNINNIQAIINANLETSIGSESPNLGYDLSILFNDKSNINAKGNLVLANQDAQIQANADLNGNIKNLQSFKPLTHSYLPNLTNLNLDANLNFSDGEIQLNINQIVADYLKQKIELKGHANYGIDQTNHPINGGLFLTYNQDKIQLNANGFWQAQDNTNINLLANIQDLEQYSNLLNFDLPNMNNVILHSSINLSPSMIEVKSLKLKSSLDGSLASLDFSGNYDFDNHDLLAVVNDLNLNGLEASGNFSLTHQKSGFNYLGNLKANASSLSGANQLLYTWLDFYFPELTDIKLESSFSGNQLGGKANLDFNSNAMDINGKIKLVKPTADIYQVDTDLLSQYVNLIALRQTLDNAKSTLQINSSALSYVSEKNPKDSSKSQDNLKASNHTKEQIQNSEPWLNLSLSQLLKKYQLDIEYKIKNLILAVSQTSKNASISLKTSSEGASLNLSAEDTFDGKININADLSPYRNKYHLNINSYAGDLNLKPVLLLASDNLPIESGLAMAELQAQSIGNTPGELIRNLNGKAKLGAESVQFKIFKSDSLFGKLLLLLAGGKWDQTVNIKCALANFDIKDGVFNTSDMFVDSDGALVFGQGFINLPKEEINLVLTPKAKYINLSTFAVPLTLSGSFSKLYLYPNTSGTIVKIGAAAALIATGIGAIGLLASEAGQGIYRANKDYCQNALTRLPPSNWILSKEKKQKGLK